MSECSDDVSSGTEPAGSHSKNVPGGAREASPDPTPVNDGYLIATYRYARLAIVIVIFALVVSLVLERAHATCWNDSISASYYTPVHSIFVATLAVLGVSLFAIRGGTPLEEILLNMAGFLAPVVALVPTGWSSSNCPSNLTATSEPLVNNLLKGNGFFAKFSSNNLIAFIISGSFAVILTIAVTLIRSRKNPAKVAGKHRLGFQKEVGLPAIGSVLVVIAGFIWRYASPANFRTHAHSYSAIIMFVLVGLVMLSTAERERDRDRDPGNLYKWVYFVCPGVMALGAVAVVIGGVALKSWHHEVLVLEIVELVPFVVFWFFQTIQLWDIGPPAPDKYAEARPLTSLRRRLTHRGSVALGDPGGGSLAG